MTAQHINLLSKIILENATLKDFQIMANRDVIIDFLRGPESKRILSKHGILTSNQPGSFYIFEANNPDDYRYIISKVGSVFKWKIFSRDNIPLK